MPTYEYECTSCKHSFEAFQAMSEAPLKECPQCGKAVRRLIHGGTGVIFKGSGFYVTDKGKSAKSSKPDQPASAETSKPAESKPPAADAAKADSAKKTEGSSSGEAAPAAKKNT
jgi:putative FmdB family regulatory protein